MTAQTVSFRYELACKGDKAQHLVTQQNDICCFIGAIFEPSFQLRFFTIMTFKYVNNTTYGMKQITNDNLLHEITRR